MKRMIYILSTLLILFIASQIWAKSLSSKIEMPPFEVLKTFNGFEIRKYEPATFSYVTLDVASYKEGSSLGFRKLAGYIFGGNDKGQKIAMTSPVEIEMDTQMVMKFLVPAEYKLEDLPVPNNKEVQFVEEPERTVASITFGGFASDTKIALFKEKLVQLLAEQNIKHKNEFSFLGYNSPFDLINRRNEMIVAVDFE
ncbi:MAG: heme-binding protein [Crocinitomix sp.]|nr:heme-binding protein [Crocinitomix sp.]